jgi:hypothetical protein
MTLMRILSSVLLFFFVLLSFNTYAQISIGIKGGPDFSKFTNAVQGPDASGDITTQSSGTKTQFYGQVFVDIPLDTSRWLNIRPGIEYIGAGGSMSPTGDYYVANGFQPSTKYALHYVDVPVEFVFSPKFDWGGPVVGFGLYFGDLLNGTIKPTGGSSSDVKIGNSSGDNFQRFDFGYCWTIGLQTKVGFLFGVDYQHGFLQVTPNTITNNQHSLNTHNSIWGLHLGWVFQLGHKK